MVMILITMDWLVESDSYDKRLNWF